MIAEIELSFTLCKKYRSYSKNWKMVEQKLETEGCTGTGSGSWLTYTFYFKQLLHDTVHVIQT